MISYILERHGQCQVTYQGAQTGTEPSDKDESYTIVRQASNKLIRGIEAYLS